MVNIICWSVSCLHSRSIAKIIWIHLRDFAVLGEMTGASTVKHVHAYMYIKIYEPSREKIQQFGFPTRSGTGRSVPS